MENKSSKMKFYLAAIVASTLFCGLACQMSYDSYIPKTPEVFAADKKAEDAKCHYYAISEILKKFNLDALSKDLFTLYYDHSPFHLNRDTLGSEM